MFCVRAFLEMHDVGVQQAIAYLMTFEVTLKLIDLQQLKCREAMTNGKGQSRSALDIDRPTPGVSYGRMSSPRSTHLPTFPAASALNRPPLMLTCLVAEKERKADKAGKIRTRADERVSEIRKSASELSPKHSVKRTLNL